MSPGGGGGTPILDLTGCAAQQDVLCMVKLCNGVSFSDKKYATGYYNLWGFCLLDSYLNNTNGIF